MFSRNEFKTAIILFFTIFSFSFSSSAQTRTKFKVVLDAGHGGKDPGARYSGHKEKDITLAVTLKVGKLLENNPNIGLIYTRKSDDFVELRERAKIANRANADLFISIHCNANKNATANGSETYVMGMSRSNMNFEVSKTENSVIFLEDNYKKAYKGFDPNNPGTLIGLKMVQENNLTSSISFAKKIQNNFSSTSGVKSRGIKQEPLWVLDASIMPGVLIEIGFISSPVDISFLESENGQNDIAQSIADAIVSYKNENFEEERGEENFSTVKKEGVKNDTLETIFKIQFAASKNKLALVPKNFKGIKNVSLVYEDNVYKYFCGETSDYENAKSQLKEVKSKGYDSAFLIAYKNGKKISVQEAVK